ERTVPLAAVTAQRAYARAVSGVILGREKELRLANSFLDSLPHGSAACVLTGEPGIGKTAVWSRTVARARAASLRVLSCAPAELEAALSYAALTDLLADVEPHVFAA